jgi:hypothetical protein
MPKQVVPDKKAFSDFFEMLEKEFLCKRVKYQEIQSWIDTIPQDHARASIRTPKSGTETCYVYDRAGHPVRVVIWTTYVAANEQARTSDAGWVLLIDKRKPSAPIFYSFPVHRTKNFLVTLKKYVAAFIALVDTWPEPCTTCGKTVTIRNIKGEALLQYAFMCPKRHPLKMHYLYQNLPNQHKTFLEARFKKYAEYREKLAAEGKVVVPRVFIRAGVAGPNRKKVASSEEFSQINPLTEAFPFNDLQYEE